MKKKSSVKKDDSCPWTDCRFYDCKLKRCDPLDDTDFNGKPCPFYKPRKKKKSR